jgi:hypothetical protein
VGCFGIWEEVAAYCALNTAGLGQKIRFLKLANIIYLDTGRKAWMCHIRRAAALYVVTAGARGVSGVRGLADEMNRLQSLLFGLGKNYTKTGNFPRS